MTKFFEYEDKEVAGYVEKLVALAEDAEINETTVKKDETIYANNNIEKPFANMTAADMELRQMLGETGGKSNSTVARHREEQKELVEQRWAILKQEEDEGIKKVAKVVVAEYEKERKNMSFLAKVKEALLFSKKTKQKKIKIESIREVADK